MPLLAALLLAAVPIVGPEIVSTPIHPAPTAVTAPGVPTRYAVRAAAPLATDGDGFVLAFAAATDAGPARTIVTRLDSQAQAVPGTAREIATTDADADAVMPEIVAAPNGFFVAQTEVAPKSWRVVVWHLDRALQPDPAPFAIVPFSVSAGVFPPGIVRVAGNRVFVVVDRTVSEYDLSGALQRTTVKTFSADDAVVIGGALVTVGDDSRVGVTFACGIGTICVQPQQPNFSVFVAVDGAPWAADLYNFPFYSPNRIAVAADGSTLLSVFDQRDGPSSTVAYTSFLRINPASGALVDRQPHVFATSAAVAGDLPQRPAVAFDGTRFLAVWTVATPALPGVQHAIGAAAIDRDGTVTPIAIPNLADETSPFVVAVGPNRFLISYLSRRDGEYRLVGRFITFGGRRPVVGR